MAEVYSYVANKNGTLTKPFRYVREGETVTSPEPLKFRWLTPKEDYKPKAKNLPIMSNMRVVGENPAHHRKPEVPKINDETYTRNIKDVKRMEGLIDASKTAAPPSTASASQPGAVVGEPATPAGTGDQAVL